MIFMVYTRRLQLYSQKHQDKTKKLNDMEKNKRDAKFKSRENLN